MKSNATDVYGFTGQLYESYLIYSADYTVAETRYLPPREIKLSIKFDQFGRMVANTKEFISSSSYIMDITDINGDLIWPGGGCWQATLAWPNLNPLGFINGYTFNANPQDKPQVIGTVVI